jgi:hypothetical protein
MNVTESVQVTLAQTPVLTRQYYFVTTTDLGLYLEFKNFTRKNRKAYLHQLIYLRPQVINVRLC